MLVVSVALKVPEAEQAHFLAISRSLIDASRLEPGVLAYSFAIDIFDKGMFRIFEIYNDRAALEAHMASGHFKEWRSQTHSYERVERHILDTI